MMPEAIDLSGSATASRTVLHVGCGAPNAETLHRAFRGPGWREVRLDVDPGVQPDIVASIVDMQGVESASCDALYSSHNIEHLFAHEVVPAFGEFARVLKPEGFALVTCPDLQSIAALVASGRLEETAYASPAGPIAALDMIYGLRSALAQGRTFMAHHTGFTAKTLGNALINGGFTRAIVERDAQRCALWAIGFKSEVTNARLRSYRDALFPSTPGSHHQHQEP